jgi:protein-tyrosine phosphatase
MSVILPNLILGGFHESFDHDLLTRHRVTHILNVATELNVSERVGRVYAKHAVPDDCLDSDISLIMEPCMDFIKAAHSEGGHVFVHCLEGVSRSACVVLCYLVKHIGWKLDEAMAHLRDRRHCVDPFPSYMEQTRRHLARNQSV